MKSKTIKLIILCFIVSMTSTVSAAAETRILKIAYSDVEFFPYQMGNGLEIANPPGIALDLINEAAKELGIQIEYIRLPNKRVLYSLKSGAIQGAFCYSFSADRLSSGAYPMKAGKPDRSQRINTISYYLYKQKNSPLTWDGKTIANLNGKVGANSGNSIVDNLKELGLQCEDAITTDQNLKKLSYGRIAAYAGQDTNVNVYIAKGHYGDIIQLPIPLVTKDYYLLFSNQFMSENPELAKKIWSKIAEIRDSRVPLLLPKYPTITP